MCYILLTNLSTFNMEKLTRPMDITFKCKQYSSVKITQRFIRELAVIVPNLRHARVYLDNDIIVFIYFILANSHTQCAISRCQKRDKRWGWKSIVKDFMWETTELKTVAPIF